MDLIAALLNAVMQESFYWWKCSGSYIMQESFWWWQNSDRYVISLFPHLHLPVPNTPYGFCERKTPRKKKNTLQLRGWNESTAGPPTSSREWQAARSGRRLLEVRSGGWCPSGEVKKHRHKGRLSEGRDPAKGSSRHLRLAYSVSLTPLCFLSLGTGSDDTAKYLVKRGCHQPEGFQLKLGRLSDIPEQIIIIWTLVESLISRWALSSSQLQPYSAILCLWSHPLRCSSMRL